MGFGGLEDSHGGAMVIMLVQRFLFLSACLNFGGSGLTVVQSVCSVQWTHPNWSCACVWNLLDSDQGIVYLWNAMSAPSQGEGGHMKHAEHCAAPTGTGYH